MANEGLRIGILKVRGRCEGTLVKHERKMVLVDIHVCGGGIFTVYLLYGSQRDIAVAFEEKG